MKKYNTKSFFNIAGFNHFDGIHFRQNTRKQKISSAAMEFSVFTDGTLAENLFSATGQTLHAFVLVKEWNLLHFL